MEQLTIGTSGILVPPLCLGGNVFGWTVDPAASHDLLDRALAAGLNFIDTADVYSFWVPGNRGGESETIIGDWMAKRGNRGRLVIATKVGHDFAELKGRLTRAYIRNAVEGSLRRLRTDVIDLYYSHFDDLETPIDETLSAYAELIAEGKVRAIGASNFSSNRLRASLDLAGREGLPRYQAMQPHYNLYERAHYEGALQDAAVWAGLSVFPYFGLARGFLTGKYRTAADLTKSARGQGNAQFLNSKGLAILEALDAIAAETKTTPAEVALSWLRTRPGVTAPIASATSPKQLDLLVRSASLDLTAAQAARLTMAGT